jgi:RIO-like serine/threonine protein kinase
MVSVLVIATITCIVANLDGTVGRGLGRKRLLKASEQTLLQRMIVRQTTDGGGGTAGTAMLERFVENTGQPVTHSFATVKVHPQIAITKTFIRYNTWTHQTPKEAWTHEVSILERLNSIPPPCEGLHVPKLLAHNEKTLVFSTSWDGVPLTASASRTQFCKLSARFILKQAECMDTQLGLANVTHCDMHKSGKNMMLDGTRLVLIDFNIATLDGRPKFLAKNRLMNTAIADFVRMWRWENCKTKKNAT